MTILRLLKRRESLLLLLALLLLAGTVGGVQTLMYRYVHKLDCDASSARNHPRCQPRVTLLLNGKISTLADPPQVEALAAQGGEIIAAGSSEALKARFPDAIKVDLNGYRAFPGFQDARVDLLDAGLGLARLDLEPATDLRRCLELIESFVKGHPDDPWILGQGWSVTALGGQPPSRKGLDELLPDRPMFLWRDDHRAAALNSEALKQLGITPKSSDPAGGRIDRDRSGAPTGLLEGAAADQAFERIAAGLPSWMVKQALLAAQGQLVAAGVTRVDDQQILGLPTLVALGELYEAGLWRVRVTLSPDLEQGRGWAYRLYRPLDAEVLEVGGPAAMLDGGLAERQASFSVPYPDNSPVVEPRIDAARLGGLLARTDRAAPTLVAHGDRALNAALYGLDRAAEIEHPRIWSLIWSDAAIARASRRGVCAVITPRIAVDWPALRSVLPDALAPSALRFSSLLKAGLPVVFGSGWPRHPLPPLVQLQAAISNQDSQGDPIMPEWHNPELLTLEQALEAYTRVPARLGGRAMREGTLEVGRLEDLVVLDRDLLSRSPLEFDTTQVVMTIIGGEVVWRREGGMQFRIDEASISSSPSWFKVLARQHFLPLILSLAMLTWPLWTVLMWMWRFRPRPQPLKVLAGGPERSDGP